jgi:hypothetical protein
MDAPAKLKNEEAAQNGAVGDGRALARRSTATSRYPFARLTMRS